MINEIFPAIQGEGKTQGQYRTFIRFNGCNLSCSFCDTPYTWGKGDCSQTYHTSLITDEIVITGGEPCLPTNWEFIENNIFVNARIKWIELETNGTIIPKNSMNYIDLWNISPKNIEDMKNKGHNTIPYLLSVKDQLNDYIVKFVIGSKDDLAFVFQIKEQFQVSNNKIWLMPLMDKQGNIDQELVYNLAFQNRWNYSDRLHVSIKGNKRGI